MGATACAIQPSVRFPTNLKLTFTAQRDTRYDTTTQRSTTATEGVVVSALNLAWCEVCEMRAAEGRQRQRKGAPGRRLQFPRDPRHPGQGRGRGRGKGEPFSNSNLACAMDDDDLRLSLRLAFPPTPLAKRGRRAKARPKKRAVGTLLGEHPVHLAICFLRAS